MKHWLDEDGLVRLEPQVKRGLYGKLSCDQYWDNGYTPRIADPLWLDGYDGFEKVDVRMTLELSDSETAPTWKDTLEYTYMPSLNIWMFVDHCKKADSDEIYSGVDCPWSMNFEQYVWYTCDAAFKGVARKPAAEPFNPLERGTEYSLGFTLYFIDHDSK